MSTKTDLKQCPRKKLCQARTLRGGFWLLALTRAWDGSGGFVIHNMHVDARPHGRDRAEDQTVSDRSHRPGVGPSSAAAAEAGDAWPQAGSGPAGIAERHPLHCAHGRQLADAAEGLPALAKGVLVVPTIRAADPVPDHPRHRADGGQRTAGREASPSAGVSDSQTVRAPARGEARLRRGEEDCGPQAPRYGRHRSPSANGHPDLSRHLGQRWRPVDPRCHPQALAVGQAPVRQCAYDRTRLMHRAAFLYLIIAFVCRVDNEPGFKVLPRRWVVERTSGRLTAGARLPTAPRCLRGHDPPRHGKPPAAPDQSLRQFSKEL